MGLTYKQVLRRMKDELTVLKKSAEDMRGAVDEFDSAMQQEKLRLRSAMQSRREALSLWQDVQRIREESRNVWLQKIQARERVAENTTKEREALEHSMEERDRSRKRAHLMAKREAQVAAAAKLSEGKVPFHGPGSREAPGVSEEQMVVRELRQAHHQEEMMGGAHGMIANQRTEVHGAVRQRQAAAQHAIETLEGFMREVQVAGLEELFAKLKALEEKGVAAQAQRDKLEAEVLDLQEQVKELGVERDAERLRLEGMPGTGRDVSQGLERQVESATGRLGRSRLALVRAEQSLAQVLMGLRLLTRRIESVIDPGAADPTVDAQTLMRMSSQRPTTKHLDVVPEGSENGAEEPDDEAGQVVEAVREAWQGLEVSAAAPRVALRLSARAESTRLVHSGRRPTRLSAEATIATRVETFAGAGQAGSRD